MKFKDFGCLLTISVILFLTISCNKEEDKLPVVSTLPVTNISQHSAVSGGNVTSAGGSELIERGLCWSTTHNPDISNSRNIDSTKITGSFVSIMKGLDLNKTYYARAYATNSFGTVYGQEVSFTTSFRPTDFDGNVYDTIKIGNQVWFKQNLKVTHYNNGDPIPEIKDDTLWQKLTTGAYYDSCAYDQMFREIYGHRYNGYAVLDSRKICPAGWHVSTDDDWNTLTDYAGGDFIAGAKLKEKGNVHWKSPNTDATDDFGFTALPAGGGSCIFCCKTGMNGLFWSVKATDDELLTFRAVSYLDSRLVTSWGTKDYGLSIRCVKD
jgi:uncharacterized protein (TIGR02145 family)